MRQNTFVELDDLLPRGEGQNGAGPLRDSFHRQIPAIDGGAVGHIGVLADLVVIESFAISDGMFFTHLLGENATVAQEVDKAAERSGNGRVIGIQDNPPEALPLRRKL